MIGSNIRIQNPTPADLDAVVALHTEARASYYRGHLPDADFEGPEEVARARAGWAAAIDAGRVLGAWGEAGELAGIALYAELDGVMNLTQLHVSPARWRGGVGTALHTACTEKWRAAGVRTARLEVFEKNTRAQAFYAARGWLPDPDTPRSGNHLVLRLTLSLPLAAE